MFGIELRIANESMKTLITVVNGRLTDLHLRGYTATRLDCGYPLWLIKGRWVHFADLLDLRSYDPDALAAWHDEQQPYFEAAESKFRESPGIAKDEIGDLTEYIQRQLDKRLDAAVARRRFMGATRITCHAGGDLIEFGGLGPLWPEIATTLGLALEPAPKQ